MPPITVFFSKSTGGGGELAKPNQLGYATIASTYVLGPVQNSFSPVFFSFSVLCIRRVQPTNTQSCICESSCVQMLDTISDKTLNLPLGSTGCTGPPVHHGRWEVIGMDARRCLSVAEWIHHRESPHPPPPPSPP